MTCLIDDGKYGLAFAGPVKFQPPIQSGSRTAAKAAAI